MGISRKKFMLWWSTAPRNVGYPKPGERPDLGEGQPDFTGTPKQILSEIQRINRVCGGAFVSIKIRDLTGNEWQRQDLIEEMIIAWNKGGRQ